MGALGAKAPDGIPSNSLSLPAWTRFVRFPVRNFTRKSLEQNQLTEPLLPQVDVRSTYSPGAAVTLVGLTTASLNGETGWVAQALDGATGRIAVRLKPLSTVRVVLVKPSNLERDWDPHSDGKEY